MEVKWPIFVPTKGRADCATLPYALAEDGIPLTLVVEPQDEEAYREKMPFASVLVLADDNQGIGFSRQSILDHARAKGLSFYWQIDDNIRGFCKVQEGRCLPVSPAEALLGAEGIASRYERVALVGLAYQQFAWSARKSYQFNRRAYCCVLTNTQTEVNYRPRFDLKEDVDFLLQHIASGKWVSILVNKWAMRKPKMGGSDPGGLAPLYAENRHSEIARRIVAEWPRFCELVRKPDGLDARIKWDEIDKLYPFSR